MRGAISGSIHFMNLPRPARVALMALAIGALLAGMWAGLIRLGWAWPPLAPQLPGIHGPLMVCGFLGTLIGLERAVGLGRRWMLAAPLLSGVGAILALTPLPILWSALCMAAGSVVLVAALAQLLRIQAALFIVTIVLGGVLWLVGNLLWLAGQPIPVAALWWAGFLVVTIAGERLELSRMLRLSSGAQGAFAAALGTMVVAMSVAVFSWEIGVRLLGAGLLLLALWLLRYDIAWRRLRVGGQAQFTALSLIAGYFWLALGGLLALVLGAPMAGPLYDAILHALFVGFVFSMVFGHAPIIFPAVLQLPVRYSPLFYSHLILLHAGLVLRVAGDLIPYWPARLTGGLINALVILLFLGNTLFSVVRGRTQNAPAAP